MALVEIAKLDSIKVIERERLKQYYDTNRKIS